MDKYYYVDSKGVQAGPISPIEFKRFGINNDTLVWKQGMSGAKGQTVLYAILKPADTTLRYCRYDGGRAATALSPGKIDGWVILSGAGGAVTHRVEKDADGNIILVPVEE